MITYECIGKLPRGFAPLLLPRIARECAKTRVKTKKGSWHVGLSFVTPLEMRRMNRAYRGKDCPTDVLSFATDEGDSSFPRYASLKELGDIAIAPTVAVREARRRAMDPTEELIRLIAHGTLHLLGFEHADAKQEERMFALQEEIVEQVAGGR